MMYTIFMEAGKSWCVIYYEGRKGCSEVYDFIDDRKDREKAKIIALLDVLEEQGPQLPRPYADILEDGIHELRVKLSGNQVRILYFFCFREFIILTNVLIKTTDRVPPSEINKAKKLRTDFLQRYNEETLRRIKNENT
jgi:hypothetical protein